MVRLVNRSRSLLFALIMISVAALVAALIYTGREADRRATDHEVRPFQAGPSGALTNTRPAPADGRIESEREAHPVLAHTDPVRVLYAARTLSELEIAATMMTGERMLDAKAMEYLADRFCSFGSYDGGSTRTFEETARAMAMENDADGMSSAQWLDRRRATFCEGRFGPPILDPLSVLNLSQEAGIDDLARLESAFSSLGINNEGVDVLDDDANLATARRDLKDELRAQVLDFMARTSSPAAFSRASELLLDADDWYPGGTRAKASRQMGLPYWRMVGSELAFCQLAPSACAAGSLTVISRCMPMNCRPGESLQDYYRRTQSLQSIEIADAYADALLAMRRGKP